MLYKDDVSLLDALISDIQNEPIQGYKTDDICQLMNRRYSDVRRTIEHLTLGGFVSKSIGEFGPNGNRYEADVYRLTERGKFYKQVRKHQRIDYFLSKWTDILACMIALISLIVSIYTNISN